MNKNKFNWRGVLLSLLLLTWCYAATAFVDDIAPVYIYGDNGWTGLFAHNNVYAEFSYENSGAPPENPYRILLRPGLGMMLIFADKREFDAGHATLDDHIRWELDYWRKTAKVESLSRDDLSGKRNDLKVTEMNVTNDKGRTIKIYVIALAADDGVFVLSISPADRSVDPLAKKIAASFRLVRKRLDPEEVTRRAKAMIHSK